MINTLIFGEQFKMLELMQLKFLAFYFTMTLFAIALVVALLFMLKKRKKTTITDELNNLSLSGFNKDIKEMEKELLIKNRNLEKENVELREMLKSKSLFTFESIKDVDKFSIDWKKYKIPFIIISVVIVSIIILLLVFGFYYGWF